MHFGDSIFIFLLALVLFGPKKLPEIGRTIGKLLAEFRRASNEFKFQIQEELRNMEDDERRKKLAEQQAQNKAAEGSEAPALVGGSVGEPGGSSGPTILPPSTGAPVSTGRPYAAAVTEGSEVTSGTVSEGGAGAAEGLAHEVEATAAVDLTAHTNGSYNQEGAAEPAEPGVEAVRTETVETETVAAETVETEAVRSGAGGEPLHHG